MSHPVQTDHPVHELISKRWSPYLFSQQPVSKETLQSLFEAARWAASSYNEQPWSYIVATQEDGANFSKIVSCLIEFNQTWAGRAPVLAIGCASTKLSRNGQPNGAALHDLGQATAQLAIEATARNLHVHQMAGFLPDRAREQFGIPEGVEPTTCIAIGYAGSASSASDSELASRDANRRPRKTLADFVFTGRWGTTSSIVR